MILVWPQLLWALALLPALAALYLLIPRRKRPASTRFASLAATAIASRPTAGWRRHAPPALLLVALGVLTFATSRPALMTTLSGPRSTIILAMDVSQSMAAEDIEPNRHAASQQAARTFIAQQPPNVEIGIIAFAGIAFVAQPPTTDHGMLDRAIERLELSRSTAVGSGIVMSLQTIFPDIDLSRALYGEGLVRADKLTNAAILGAAETGTLPELEPEPIAIEAALPGSYETAIVILMTDGATTVGPSPRKAGQLAADLGVRVFTIGFGSDKGAVVLKDGRKVNADVDEPTLIDVAEKTGANYFRATSAGELADVYASMSTRFVGETVMVELAFLFAGIGALIATLAGGLSLFWFGRVA